MSLSTRVLALVVLTLAVPACKKAGTSAPGGGSKGLTVEESDKKRSTAQGLAKALTLVGLANEDLSKGRWVSARERAKRALEAEPNNADAFAVLGAANWRVGDVPKPWSRLSLAARAKNSRHHSKRRSLRPRPSQRPAQPQRRPPRPR